MRPKNSRFCRPLRRQYNDRSSASTEADAGRAPWRRRSAVSKPSTVTRPGGRLEERGDDPQERRLAGAVGPDEADDLAAIDGQVDVAERLDGLLGRRLDQQALEAGRSRVDLADAPQPAASTARPRAASSSRNGGDVVAQLVEADVRRTARAGRRPAPSRRGAVELVPHQRADGVERDQLGAGWRRAARRVRRPCRTRRRRTAAVVLGHHRGRLPNRSPSPAARRPSGATVTPWPTPGADERTGRTPAGLAGRASRRRRPPCSSSPSSWRSCCATPSSPPTARSAGWSPAASSPCSSIRSSTSSTVSCPRWIAVIVVLLGVLGVVGHGHGRAWPTTSSTRSTSSRPARPRRPRSSTERHDWMAELDVADRVAGLRRRPRRAGPQGRRLAGRRDRAVVRRDGHPHAVPAGLRPALLRGVRRPVPRGAAGRHPHASAGRPRCAGGSTSSSRSASPSSTGCSSGRLCWALDLPAAISLGFAVGVFTLDAADRCARRRHPGPAPGVRAGGVARPA